MRRVIGTLAVHAILAGALIAMHHEPAVVGGEVVATITIDEPAPQTPTTTTTAIAGTTGGGHAAARTRRGVPRGLEPTTVAGIVGDVQIDRDGIGTGRGTGRGTGNGNGNGNGNGIGNGNGYGYGDGFEIPPAPKISKARAARLIFPSRQVAIEEAALFVARLQVDDEGFVVGAHLARGFGGKRDDDAMSAVWRFRYDPARDDDGKAIRSTVEQHFHLAM